MVSTVSSELQFILMYPHMADFSHTHLRSTYSYNLPLKLQFKVIVYSDNKRSLK